MDAGSFEVICRGCVLLRTLEHEASPAKAVSGLCVSVGSSTCRLLWPCCIVTVYSQLVHGLCMLHVLLAH
jgi:hypothetical protein